METNDEEQAATTIKKKKDIAKRWGGKLTNEGFTPISEYFLKYYAQLPKPITAVEAMFIVHIMMYKWDENYPFPGCKAIAKSMGVTDTTVRNYARSLEEKGYLKRIMRVGETNRYNLQPLFDAVEKKAQEEIKKQKNKK